MSSYFQSIRRLKDAQFYINEITKQFAMWKATQDQVDNTAFKAYQRATTNRLICKEQAAIPIQQDAEFWKPQIPQEPDGGVITPPSAASVTLMLNFDHELEDRSNWNNDAIFEFTNNQLMFTDGATSALSFAVDFNRNSNVTYDKLWVPFSNSTQIVYDTPSGFSIFTRIKPTVVSDLGTPTTPGPAPASNRVKYHGGAVRNVHNAEVQVIWWGSAYNSGSAQSRRQEVQSAMEHIKNSDYWKGLWEYSNCKPVGSVTNVVNTTESIPGGSEITFAQIVNCIKDSRDEGQVPDWNDFEEFSSLAPTENWDFRHIYCVILPPGKLMPPGYGGATSVTNDGGGTTLFNWCAIYGPHDSPYAPLPDRSQVQTVTQGLCHELIHAMVTPAVGGCGPNGAWLFNEPGFCNNIQHGPPEQGCSSEHLGGECKCGNRLKIIPGNNNALVESYWSNMAGRCVCPGVDSFWVRPPATPPTTPGNSTIRRYIFQKMDDLDNGATAAIDPNGVIYFNVKKNATEYKVKTTAGRVVVGQWADLWFAFDYATNSPRIFVNGVLFTTASTEALLWNNTHSHMIIGNYNMGATVGQLRAAMDDFRLYRNSVITSDQVDNLTNNGLTITNIDPTQEVGVAIVNRVRLNSPLANSGVFVSADAAAGDVAAPMLSFTPTSFTTTSFTA